MRPVLAAAALCAGLSLTSFAPPPSVAAEPSVVISTPQGVNHAPTLAVLRDESLLTCWYAGRAEYSPDVAIVCARSGDGGVTWSPSRIAVPPGEQASGGSGVAKTLGNPVLYQQTGGRLWLIYGEVQRYETAIGNVCKNWRCGRIDVRASMDGGATWSRAFRLIDAPGALPRAHVVNVEGRALLPAYLEGARTGFVVTLDLAGAVPAVAAQSAPAGPNVIQPALAPTGPGAVRAYFRARGAGWVQTATLDVDTGAWSRLQRTNLPNPDAAVEALIAHDGQTVLIYNPSRSTRAALALATSIDGVRFDHGCTLFVGPGDVAYPSAVFMRDGALALAYSARSKGEIRFARLDRNALAACMAQPLP